MNGNNRALDRILSLLGESEGYGLQESVWVPTPYYQRPEPGPESFSGMVNAAIKSWVSRFWSVALKGVKRPAETQSESASPACFGYWDSVEFGEDRASTLITMYISPVGPRLQPSPVGTSERASRGNVVVSYNSDGASISKEFKFDDAATPEEVGKAIAEFLPW